MPFSWQKARVRVKTPSPSPGANAGQNINNIRTFFPNEGRLIEQLHSRLRRAVNSQKYRAGSSRFCLCCSRNATENSGTHQWSANSLGVKVIPEKHKTTTLSPPWEMQPRSTKTSDLDRFWGFIGESGIAIGKFGNDIKPYRSGPKLTDIVKKAIQIQGKLSGTYTICFLILFQTSRWHLTSRSSWRK